MLLSILSALVLATSASQRSTAVKPEATPRITSACNAVTKAEIEAALGRSVAKTDEHAGRAESTCAYTADGGELTIALRHSPIKVDLAAEIRNLEAAFPDAKRHDTPGMGSRAFVMELPGIGAQMHVFTGDRDYLLVSVLGLGEGSRVVSAVVNIARRALGRME